MINKRLQPALLLFLLLAGGNLFGQAPASPPSKYEFSAKQCIEFANKNSVQVKNALLNVQMQQQQNRDVTSAALPNITGSVGATDYLDIPTTLVPGQFAGQPPGTYVPLQFGTKYNANGTVQLQQLLFDGQVFVGLQARRTAIDFQMKNVEVTQQTINTNIYKIYYQLVVSKTQISLLDANIAQLQKLEHDTREMYKNGFSEKLDVDKVTVQIANLQTEKLKTLNTVSIGYLGLKTLIGMPVKDVLVLTDSLTEDQIKTGVLDGANYQYTDRKEYQYLELNRKLNEYNIRRYKLAYLPTVSLNGVYTKTAQRDQFNFFGKGDWFTTSYIGLNVSIPIFDGFSKDAKLKQARITMRQTDNQLSDLKLNIDSEVEQATLNFKTAIATMDYQKQNMELAQSVYDQTKKKYEVGTGSNTEITNAETSFKTAQTNYINALYDGVIAKIDFLKATGKLQ
ncbi:TolC family protein [Chitinophagaceae bacterium LWZ2-11]